MFVLIMESLNITFLGVIFMMLIVSLLYICSVIRQAWWVGGVGCDVLVAVTCIERTVYTL